MQITRRDVFALAAGLAAVGLIQVPANASEDAVEAAIKELAGGMTEVCGC